MNGDRHLRRFAKDRETIEKSRLRERTGSYHRYEDPGVLTAVDPRCPSSLPSKEAFIVTEDVARLEHEDRQYQQAVKEEMNERRRAEKFIRDSERWAFLEGKAEAEKARSERLQEDPLAGRKNQSGHPFNIVTLQYEDNKDGASLAYMDKLHKYKAELRSTYLAVQGHLGFNPITGEQTIPITTPVPPQKPLL